MLNLHSNGATDLCITSEAISAFADATVPRNDRLRLSAGLPHIREAQHLISADVSNGYPGTLPTFEQSAGIEDGQRTGRLSLAWDFADRPMGHAGASADHAACGDEQRAIAPAIGGPATFFTITPPTFMPGGASRMQIWLT